MWFLLLGIFLILHAEEYLVFERKARRIFELQSGLEWGVAPREFYRLLGDGVARGKIPLMKNLRSVASFLSAFYPSILRFTC
jgi:hypothetical protein